MYHRLRSITSPVLIATGFVNGRGQSLTPQNPHPLTDHQKLKKTLLLLITSATPMAVPNLVQIHPQWASGSISPVADGVPVCKKMCAKFLFTFWHNRKEAPLSPRDRTMRRVSWNLANCRATVQKRLVRQVLNKSKLWSWRVKVGRCVINMCTQPWRIRVAFIVLYVS